MRHYEFVGAVELAQGGLDLGPRRRALGVGGVHQQLRDLRQCVPDALHGHREWKFSLSMRHFFSPILG
jgi:hypothetical protein